MRINFNVIQPKNTIINAARVNASFAKNNSRTGKSAGTGRSDRADFLAPGKADEHDRESDKAEADHH